MSPNQSFTLFACALALLLCSASALPTIAPAALDCGNGIFCASGQTCMSNSSFTGVGHTV